MQRILIHGLGQTAASWDRVRAHGAERAAACPELSALFQDGEHTFESLYRGFSDYCGRFRGPLELCGLSLGGVLALRYAIDHPDHVHALVLIGAQYRMPRGLLRFQNGVFRLMPERAFQGMGFGKAEVLRLMGSMLDIDLGARLGEIVCPVLVLCGERDRANRRAAEELAGEIAGAELRLIEGAGHEVNTEAPAALAGAVDDFFRRHERPDSP